MNYRRYRIAICDDERAEAERLGSVVSDWSRAAGIDCAIDTVSGAEALRSARTAVNMIFSCLTLKCAAWTASRLRAVCVPTAAVPR